MYDVAIVGAGINGTSVAYEFLKAKKSVIIFDMEGIASGGSGAAGAFIAPKFSKAGELKELIHNAFIYSMEFYEKNFPQSFKKTTLIHIANDEKSSDILKYYKEQTTLKLKDISKEFMDTLEDDARAFESISLDAGVVDAQAMCKELSSGAKYIQKKVDAVVYNDGAWVIDELYSAKILILATGAYETLIKEPYLKLRGVWGHRIDIQTSTKNFHSIHQNVSISPSINSTLSIGATHDVHYHPQTSSEPYDIEMGRKELLEKASKTISLKDIRIIKDYTGLRSSSFDYMPLVGSLVISKVTLDDKKIRFKTKKPNFSEYIYYPNLYMINGNGGYGFVLSPYLAKILSEYILSDKEINERLTPARFFARWARKL